VDRSSGALCEHGFADLPDLLDPGDLLVLNDSRVFAARLWARRKTGGQVEVLLLGSGPAGVWRALVRPSKAVRVGEELVLPDETTFAVHQREADGISRSVEFPEGVDPFEVAARFGEPPLPPYIRRKPRVEDQRRYQTIYAQEPGSAAAPTAGLHFSTEVLQRLRERGIETAYVTLHVGPGTFLPIRARTVEDHRVQEEFCVVGPAVFHAVARARQGGGRVVAVGTTVVRSLETAFRRGDPEKGFADWTDLYIYPPFDFACVTGLLTNFHLPKSSLLVLVCAFAGKEIVLRAYETAVKGCFRFYSYGDAMLIV
jgi:S-adenosylmethionine:tRNA ribosyltransferase-isomerase